MNTTLPDRRIRRTQESLAKALITLTLENGYEAITIRDITEVAGVGYATFFRHYRDKDELLQDTIDVVLEELVTLFSPALQQDNSAVVGAILFEYVQQHSEIVKVLVRSRIGLQHVIDKVTHDIAHRYAAISASEVPLELAANHIVASTIALIEWWLTQGMSLPPEKMGWIYSKLISEPTRMLAFIPQHPSE